EHQRGVFGWRALICAALSDERLAPPFPFLIWAFVSFVIERPLLFRNVTICWPVASLTMFARSRLRNARFFSGSGSGTGSVRSGLTSFVSIRIALFSSAGGTISAGGGDASWPKLKSRRKSAIQMLGIGPGRPPLLCVNSKSWASVAFGKTLFQLYVARTMLCPSRNAATENSTGIVGVCGG